MKKAWLLAPLALVGVGLGVAFGATGTTGTVTACATSPAQTISANGSVVGTVPGTAACNTATYTVPTVTQTVTTVASTTAPTTSTAPTTTAPTTTAAPPPAANLYVSPTGNNANDCATPQTACATLPGALGKATGGSVISMADGDYTTGCTISSNFSSNVTVIGSAKARLICAPLSFVNSSHIVINGPSIEQIYADKTANNLTFENLAVTCSDAAPYTLYNPDHLCDSFVMLSGAKNIALTNMTVGPTYDSSSCGGNDGSKFLGYATVVATNVTWYDDRIPTPANCGGQHQHTENLMIVDLGPQNGGSVVLNGVVFSNGPNSGEYLGGGKFDGTGPDTSMLFLDTGDTWSGDMKTGVGNVTIENSEFLGAGTAGIHADDHSSSGSPCALGNTLIENNTWTNHTTLDCTTSPTLTVRNNLGDSGGTGCALNSGSIKNNVFYNSQGGVPSNCGDSSNVTVSGASSVFANYPSDLTPAGVAVDEGDATAGHYPATDINGTARFCGAAPDAGAIERCP